MQKVLVTIIFLVVVSLTLAYFAKGSLPNSSLYNVKRLEENMMLLSKTNPDEKAKYYEELLDLRLEELEVLTSHKNEHQLILPASLRYSTTAGEYTQLIKQHDLKNYATRARAQFASHTKVLKKLIATYPRKDVGDGGDVFIVDDVNYLIIYEKELPR